MLRPAAKIPGAVRPLDRPASPGARLLALVELSLFVAGYYFCFWRAAETMPPRRVLVLTVALILLPFALNAVHRLRPDQVGYDFRRFRQAMAAALLLIAPLLLAELFLGPGRPLTTGAVLGAVRMDLGSPALAIAGWSLFALLQQSLLMGFVYERLDRASGSRPVAVATTAVLFSLSHWPNVPLAAITLAGGLVFACLYVRCRNVIPIACLHGAMTLFLFSHLSGVVSFSVGRAYRTGVQRLDPGPISVLLVTPSDSIAALRKKGEIP